jgi:hypothetical protein
MIDFNGTTTNSVGKMPGLASPASFLLNQTCGGYTVVEILDADQLDGADTGAKTDPADLPPADLVCPENSMAARFRATSDSGGSSSSGPSVVTTTTGRGAGVPVHSCPSGSDKDGALCYPSCRDGYSGGGPLCLTNCPSGYRDDGLYCFKPDSYGRGVGAAMDIKTSCSYYKGTKVIKSCKTTSTCGSKEECIGLCYNSCRDGYYAAGCNVCSPRCPAGTTDIGVSCQKGSYGRGVGKPMTCGSGEQYDAGLCYSPCPSGANGVGPLCYRDCPSSAPYRLGVQCFKNKAERDGILSAIVIGTVLTALTLGVAAAYASGPTAALIAAEEGAAYVALDSTFTVALDLAPAGPILNTWTVWDAVATMTPVFDSYIGAGGAAMLPGSAAIASGDSFLAWGIGVLAVSAV